VRAEEVEAIASYGPVIPGSQPMLEAGTSPITIDAFAEQWKR
jgi:hypothetical protein